jgi:hypothetical protein
MTESNPSDSEIEKLVAQAGIALQGLQEILGRTERDAGKVRFPRGFLHPASKWRNRLSFIRQKTVKWERKGKEKGSGVFVCEPFRCAGRAGFPPIYWDISSTRRLRRHLY